MIYFTIYNIQLTSKVKIRRKAETRRNGSQKDKNYGEYIEEKKRNDEEEDDKVITVFNKIMLQVHKFDDIYQEESTNLLNISDTHLAENQNYLNTLSENTIRETPNFLL